MIEQALIFTVQITEHVDLKAISESPKQKVAGKVRVGSPPEYRMPAVPKVLDAEITQARDLN